MPLRGRDGGEPAASRVVFGVWLAVHADEARRLSEAWDLPAYEQMVIEGLLANAVPPWGDHLLDKRCTAAVRDPRHVPVIVASSDPLLHRVLTEVWPPGGVLSCLP